MRNCNCSGASCGCLVVGGEGIEVTGIGTADSPYTIIATGSLLFDSFKVDDTTSINLTLLGSGTDLDPLRLSGIVELTAPNGSKWHLAVSNTGTLSATSP